MDSGLTYGNRMSMATYGGEVLNLAGRLSPSNESIGDCCVTNITSWGSGGEGETETLQVIHHLTFCGGGATVRKTRRTTEREANLEAGGTSVNADTD